MTAHLDPYAAAPELVNLWLRASNGVMQNLDSRLAALVEMRASQINACANCLNMHSAEARAHGETEQRLYLLSAWRDAPVYTDRERAALGWTDALTRLSEQPELESARAALQAQFSAEEQVRLTMLINIINGWNRLAVGFGMFVDPAAARAVA